MTIFIRILFACFIFQISACSNIPQPPLGQEQVTEGEDTKIKDISKILSDHLREQYSVEKILRSSHPKSNGCIKGHFMVDPSISSEYQYGIFKPGADYPVWMRFSNSADKLTDDDAKDFRGLSLKLTKVDGERLPQPGDENHTQDFLFLAHDAFFAANPVEFFDFFDAAFSDNTISFLLTHPRGALNIFLGSKRYKNPLNAHWNSVTPYALGPQQNGVYKNVVRYALRTCSVNSGEIPEPPTPDYLSDNLQNQLAKGSACLDFFIQKQVDPEKMPVENVLIAWDKELSPFIKVAQIKISKQTFTSEAQKNFCENISFNPWHSLVAHRPLGGINRTRKVVMKDISDLRLKENKVSRFEPTGDEVFEK